MKRKLTLVYIGGRKLGLLGKKILKNYKKYFNISYVFPDKNVKVDYLFNLFGEKIFTESQLNQVKIAAINFHFGHLPDYRGRFIVSHLIANGEEKSCVTCHYMNAGIDKGDIIFEAPFKIAKNETAFSLFQKCTDIGADLFEKVLRLITAGKTLPRKKQKGSGHYYPKGKLNGDEVNLNWNKKRVENFIRATTYPPFYPHLLINNVKYLIVKEDYFTVKTNKQ